MLERLSLDAAICFIEANFYYPFSLPFFSEKIMHLSTTFILGHVEKYY
jgi:hypothetical protein